MNVELLYGKGHIKASVPAGFRETVIRKPARTPLPDPRGAVNAVLAKPTGAPPLVEHARGKNSACILICDVTRPVPNHLFLRPMIEQLVSAGIPFDGITVLVATGLHRPNEGEELARVIGDPWVLERCASSTISRATMRCMSISASPPSAACPSSSTAAFSKPM
jgi:nickel-dependent lactate racemase